MSLIFATVVLLSLMLVTGQMMNCQLYRKDLNNITSVQRAETMCWFKLYNQNISNSDCNYTVYRDEKECEVLQFRKAWSGNLPKLLLTSYVYHYHYTISAFNITLSSNEFSHLKIRYQIRGGRKFCHELNLNTMLPSTAILYFDCPLFEEEFEHSILDINYSIGSKSEEETRDYKLIIPKSSNIGHETSLTKWEIFMYVDVTKLPKLVLTWQVAPKEFGVQSYVVNVTNEAGSILSSVQIRAKPEENMLSYPFHVNSGGYYFVVQMEHENCSKEECFTKSACILIETSSSVPYIIGTCLALVLLLVLAGIVCYFINIASRSGTPVVLILYKRTLQTHINAVLALALYLRDICQIDARIDEINIPLTEHQNPFDWCQETFSISDAVMVVASPLEVSNSEAGIYRDVYKSGLRLLAENFSDNQKKYFTVMLPYSKAKYIPSEAINLKRFTLPRDLDAMLCYIHHGFKLLWMSNVYCLIQKQIPGGSCYLKRMGKPLLDVFERASEDVNRVREANEHNQHSHDQNRDVLSFLPTSQVDTSRPPLPEANEGPNLVQSVPFDIHIILQENEHEDGVNDSEARYESPVRHNNEGVDLQELVL